MREEHMQGTRVLIVGSGGGIGEALSERFAGRGAELLLIGHRPEKLQAQVDALKEKRYAAEGAACDVRDRGALKSSIAQLAGSGKIDVLVYNAAAYSDSVRIQDLPEDEAVRRWDEAAEVNLSGFYLSVLYALPHLRRGTAVVIAVASQLGHVATAGQVPYCGTKGGLIHLAKALAVDLAAEKIRVVSLSPGGTATSRLTRRFGTMDEAEEKLGRKHVLGRLGTPEEVAAAAVFLAGSGAEFITGTVLLVDGGYTAV